MARPEPAGAQSESYDVRTLYASVFSRLTPDWKRFAGRTECGIVELISYALAAKPPISSVLSTLLPARKDAVNASVFSKDAPRIVHRRVDLPRDGEHCRKGQSGRYQLPHVPLPLGQFQSRTRPRGSLAPRGRRPRSLSPIAGAEKRPL
jgi:hypothetical protein